MVQKLSGKRFPSSFFLIYRSLMSRYLLQEKRIPLSGLISFLFSCGVFFRHYCCRRVRGVESAGIPVISVGNIAIGGTGKTPVVKLLCEALRERGIRCAVLSRGYRGSLSSRRGSVVIEDAHQACEVGDEPLMLSRMLEGIPVIIGKNRRLSAKKALELGCSVAILDDGLQSSGIEKDINVIVVRGQDPLGGGKFFPSGRLRDFPKRLLLADLVIVNGPCAREDKEALRGYTTAGLVSVRQKCERVRIICSGRNLPEYLLPEMLKNTAVGVFCSLGSPSGFLRTVDELGVKVVAKYLLPDHVAITEKELNFFSMKTALRKGKFLLCSEKDAVKLPRVKDGSVLPIGKIEASLLVEENQELLEGLLEQICRLSKRSQV